MDVTKSKDKSKDKYPVTSPTEENEQTRVSKITEFKLVTILYWKTIVVILVPLVFLAVPLAWNTKEGRCSYVMIIMAIFWVTEAIPIEITSLLPVALFPLLDVLSSEEVSNVYLKETNMMFIGGLSIALAIEHCNLHERIGLKVILIIGTSPKFIMLGFMLTSMFLSMWISNTATTAMMSPILAAVLKELEQRKENRRSTAIMTSSNRENPAMENLKNIKPLSSNKQEDEGLRPSDEKIGYFLSVAYACNIGGTGTIIGTGTNLTFMGIFESFFPDAQGVNFATWMLFNIPGMLANTLLTWLWLQIVFLKLFRKDPEYESDPEATKIIRELVQNEYNRLGPITFHEKSVCFLFITLIFVWFFRSPQFITGWGDIISVTRVKDATPAILMVIIMFMVPAKLEFLSWFKKSGEKPTKPSPSILTWEVIHNKLPWGIILLLGGGFSIAKACNQSGLSKWLGLQLSVMNVLPSWILVTLISITLSFATEVTANAAVANIFLPVLAEMAKVTRTHPLYFMIPATLSCSYAFLLPVATPPNAIVVEASNMKTKDMMKAGIVINFICVFVMLIMFYTLGRVVFDMGSFPSWAEDTNNSNN